jgi:hypothetical protein
MKAEGVLIGFRPVLAAGFVHQIPQGAGELSNCRALSWVGFEAATYQVIEVSRDAPV